jgi:O-antigen/teichoic acid export membrane protein
LELKTDHQQSGKPSLDKNIVTAAKGGSIGFLGKLFVQFTSLFFIFIVTRFLGTEQYGLYKLVVTISMITASICMIGLDGGIKRFLSIGRVENNTAKIWGVMRIGTIVPGLIGLALTLTIFLGANLISDYIFNKPELAQPLRLISLSIPFLILVQSFKAIAVGFKKVEYAVYAYDLGFNTIKLLLSITILFLGYQILGLIVVYIISAVISALLLFYLIKALLPKPTVVKAEYQTKEIITYSLPLFLSLLLNQFGRNFETLVLGSYGLLVDVGIYSVILSISAIGNMGFVALRTIASPIFTELHSEGNYDKLKTFYQTVTKWSLTFNLPIFLFLVIFGTNVLQLFGNDFNAGFTGLVILSASALFNASVGACGALLNMSGYSKINFYNSIIYLVCTLALDFALIPSFGLTGAALAGSLTIIIVNSLMSIQVYWLLNRIVPFNRSFYKPLTAAAVAGLLAVVLKYSFWAERVLLQTLLFGGLMLVVYFGLIIWLKLSPEDKLILEKLRKKKNK